MIEADARTLVPAIVRDFPAVRPPVQVVWRSIPPIKVIDCVLSLNRRYESFVVPRVRAFAERFPAILGCADLLELIGTYSSPAAFASDALEFGGGARGRTVHGVVQFALDAQSRFGGATEDDRLSAWAHAARPGDYLAVGVRGFGLAGFQYLRMLFGAETTKPDVHVVRYVSKVLGRAVSDVHALYALERAAELSGAAIRSLDAAIWDAGSAAASRR